MHDTTENFVSDPETEKNLIWVKSSPAQDNDWGIFVDILCKILGTNMTRIAYLSGKHPTTMSKATRGERLPSEDVAILVWDAFLKVAVEKDREDVTRKYPLKNIFSDSTREAFFNLAGHLTQEQLEHARQKTNSLAVSLDSLTKIAQLTNYMEVQNQEIEEQYALLREQAQMLERLRAQRQKDMEQWNSISLGEAYYVPAEQSEQIVQRDRIIEEQRLIIQQLQTQLQHTH